MTSRSIDAPRWLAPAVVVPAGVFFAGLAFDLDAVRIVAKPIPVLALAAAVATALPSIRYRRLVTLGLVLGAIGDVLLETDRFVPGLVAFLFGQLAYITAFVGDQRKLRPMLAVPFAAWGIGLVAALADGADELLVPVALYALVLCTMMWRAVARIGTPWIPATSTATTALGAVLFGISDSLIAIDRFGPDVAGARWWIMTSYWAAQIGIALGALAHPGRAPSGTSG